jgi:positive regulator of sigma E activity
MNRKGRVIAVENLRATICFETLGVCKNCEAGPLCHGTLKQQAIVAENNVGAKVGDTVYVEQAPGTALTSAFVLFGLPLLIAVIGLFVGARWGETVTLLTGVSCFVFGLIIAKYVNNVLARNSLFLPKITAISKEEGS